MYWNGRETFPLENEELVYLRVNSTEIEREPTLALRTAMIKAPDQSVNRANYGGKSWFTLMPEPEDDMATYRGKKLCMGVMAFPVSDIPKTVQSIVKANHHTYTFIVEHAPEQHNYYHCEVRIFVGGQRLTDADAKKLRNEEKTPFTMAKKAYRDRLRKAFETNGNLRLVFEPADQVAAKSWHRLAPACALLKHR